MKVSRKSIRAANNNYFLKSVEMVNSRTDNANNSREIRLRLRIVFLSWLIKTVILEIRLFAIISTIKLIPVERFQGRLLLLIIKAAQSSCSKTLRIFSRIALIVNLIVNYTPLRIVITFNIWIMTRESASRKYAAQFPIWSSIIISKRSSQKYNDRYRNRIDF